MKRVIVVEATVANRPADEVERSIAIPLERVLHTLTGVVETRSASTNDHCRIEVSYVSDPTPDAFRQVESVVLTEWLKLDVSEPPPLFSIAASKL